MKRFPDLRTAGFELAAKLETYRQRDDVVVLAILLGGSLVAHEVANYLGAPLDMLIIRRLFTPKGPGSQTCIVNVAGSMVIDDEIPRAAVPSTPVEYFVAAAIEELEQREKICRRDRPPLDLKGQTVILVDCGIRSGLTMQAAIEALRIKGPARIVAAAPVASEQGHMAVDAVADELVCLTNPEPFGNVAVWYTDFSRPHDDKVGNLLRDCDHKIRNDPPNHTKKH